MRDQDFWAYEGLAKDLKKLCREVRATRMLFLKHVNMTWDGIKKASPKKKKELQKQYAEWLEKGE